jgi:hypothetical protein
MCEAKNWTVDPASQPRKAGSSMKKDIDAFMFGGNTGGRFPRRSGYYVGSLIADQLAKKYSFAELCRLEGSKLKSEMEGALRELEKSPIQRK